MRAPRGALAGAATGSLLVALALALVLLESERRLVDTNSVAPAEEVSALAPGSEVCQGGEVIPRDGRRLTVQVSTGRPKLRALVLTQEGARVRGAVVGHGPSGEVTIGLPSVSNRDHLEGRICLRNTGPLTAVMRGQPTAPQLAATIGGRPQAGRLKIEWREAQARTWLARVPDIARRFGVGKGTVVGAWTFWATLALLLGVCAAAVVLAVRPPGRARRAALACAAVAAGNALVWAAVVPPFDAPDEWFHLGYAQYLAETGDVPRPAPTLFSPEQAEALLQTGVQGYYVNPQGRPAWTEAEDQRIESSLTGFERVSPGGAGQAVGNPPLYYALAAVPYRAASSGNVLDRLLAMRLLSALLAGCTAAFTFLFLRELMPATPRVWTVGALAVALQPVLAFIGGGLNNDNLLWAACAGLLWLLARAFRRGLTPKLGAAIGAAVAVGLLTKGSMLGLVPGAALGLGVLVARAPAPRRPAWRGAALAVVVAAVPFALYVLAGNVLWERDSASATAGFTPNRIAGGLSVGEQASYLWQFYLPRLPFMIDQFPPYQNYPLWDTYVQGFIGRFGWFLYGFPMWVNWLGLGALIGVGGLAVAGIARARAQVRRRAGELLTYAALLAGLLLLIAVAGYRFRKDTGVNFEQARYLLPAIGLYGAVVATAVRGLGRFAPAAGAFLVTVALGHSLFAQLLAMARYYG